MIPSKRIGRIAKGEVVLIAMIAEDLQDQFIKMSELHDDMRRKREAFDENKNSSEIAKDWSLTKRDAEVAELNFWISVHERYGHWEKNVGIRDNYALVHIKQSKAEQAFKAFIKEIKPKGFSMEEE